MATHYFGASLWLLSLTGLAAAQAWDPPASRESLPLRRLVLPSERLGTELQRWGVLVQLPRDDFEARVRAALKSAERPPTPPRLVKAVYTAELLGSLLAGGTGQWTVEHAGPGPGFLPVPSFNLALTRIQCNGSDAVFGELAGKHLGLWLAQPGTHAVYFDWNVRGQPLSDGLAFDLRLPPCAHTLIDLKLPADHVLTLGKDAGLVVGPMETEQPNQRRWRLVITGKSLVDVVVRRQGEPSGRRRLYAVVESRQQVASGAIQADFDVHLEAVQQAVAEVSFHHDAALHPYEVSVSQAELRSWELTAPAPSGQPAGLTVRLREPRQGRFQVKVRCLAALAADREWTSPWLRPRDAVLRGELVTLAFSAAQPLDRWDAGQFHVLTAQTDKHGGQLIELANLDPEAAAPRRPRGTLQSADTFEAAVRQHTHWSIQPTAMTLTFEASLKGIRGSRYELSLRNPPAPWVVDDVSWEPKEGLRNWSVAEGELLLALHQGLRAGTSAKLTVRWRAPWNERGPWPKSLPIPEPTIGATAERHATYAISLDPPWSATLVKSAVPPTAPPDTVLQAGTVPFFWFQYDQRRLDGAIAVDDGLAVPLPGGGATTSDRSPSPSERNSSRTRSADREAALAARLVAARPWWEKLSHLGSALAGSTMLAPPRLEASRLTSLLRADGTCWHHVRFQVVHWPTVELPVVLPAPARRVLAARLDGHWLTEIQSTASQGGLLVRLPPPGSEPAHVYDLYYESAPHEAVWPGVRRVAFCRPQLPLEPLRQRHVWRLPPGWTPWQQHRLAGWHGGGDVLDRFHPWWHGIDFVVEQLAGNEAPGWLAAQQFAVSTAEAGIRRKTPRDATFGELLQRFLFDGLKEQYPVVLDRQALAEAGIEPELTLSAGALAGTAPFWEAAGLVYVPRPKAPLLTTKARWRQWQSGQALPSGIDDAIAEAVAWGHDAVGQCCRADVWLRTESTVSSAPQEPYPPGLDAFLQQGTEWVVVPGGEEQSLLVVEVGFIRSVGLTGALFVALGIGWWCRRLQPKAAVRLGLTLLVAAVVGVLSLPASLLELGLWPATALFALAAVSYWRLVRTTAKSVGPPSTTRRRFAVGAAGVVLVLTGSVWFARAQGGTADIYTVYYLETANDRPVVLVHPELLKRLEEMQRGPAPAVSGAVVVTARYQGQARGAGSDFQAQFDVFSFADQTVLFLPFAGVELREGVFLRGSPIYPTAAAGKAGYLIPITGRGWQRLTLSFTVAHQALGELHELRCTLPPAPIALLEWQSPTGVAMAPTVRAAGEVRWSGAANQSGTVSAVLGREGQLQVRWRSTAVVAALNEAEVREHYYWDLSPRAPELTAVLSYVPARKNLGRVEVVLPDRMEVLAVEVTGEAAAAPPTWQVVAGPPARRLVVDFPSTVGSPFQLHLRLAPRGLGTEEVLSLRLPAPTSAKSIEGVLAYRLEGKEIADKARNLGVAGLTNEAFAAAWYRAGSRTAVLPTRAYSFRRTAVDAGLDLTVKPLGPRAQLAIDWRVGRTGAAFEIAAAWSCPRPLNYVEVLLPPGGTNLEVVANNVRHWTRHDRLLRLWLDLPAPRVEALLRGKVPTAVDGSSFLVPAVNAVGAESTTTTLTIAGEPGWSLVPLRHSGLEPIDAASGHRYRTEQPSYEAQFQLRPIPTAATMAAATSAAWSADQVIVTTRLAATQPLGDFPAMTLRWRGWAGPTPRLNLSIAPRRLDHRRDGDDHVWTVDLARGGGAALVATIHGVAAAETALTVPRLEINGQPPEQHWLVVAGELQAKTVSGVGEGKLGPAAPLPRWLGLLARPGPAAHWLQVTAADWTCSLAVKPSQQLASGKIAFAEHQWSPDGAGGWLGQSHYLLVPASRRQGHWQWPPELYLQAVEVEGREVLPLLSGDGRLTVALPAQVVVRVRLRWRPVGVVAGGAVRRSAPRLIDLEGGDEHFSLLVPPDWRGPAAAAGDQETERLAALARAAALAALAVRKDGGEAERPLYAAWRQRFLTLLRHWEYLARLRGDASQQTAAARLRKEYQPLLPAEAPVAAKSAESVVEWSTGLSEDGRPWRFVGELPQGLQLEPATHRSDIGAGRREMVVLAAILVLLMAWLPGGLRIGMALWPEQVGIAAALGCALWGLSFLALALVTLAAVGRLTMTAAWFHRRWRRGRAAAEAGSSQRARPNAANP
ncbi:MAG: hypothetical protein NZO58_03010 [Gemmataceae bacterium]|nr:hypothetical protein [Gemmataceae bacterium]